MAKPTIGARIKAARNELGLTQGKLAEKLDVNSTTISNWETDSTEPTANMMKVLDKKLFGVVESRRTQNEPAPKPKKVKAVKEQPNGVSHKHVSILPLMRGLQRLSRDEELFNVTLDMLTTAHETKLTLWELLDMFSGMRS